MSRFPSMDIKGREKESFDTFGMEHSQHQEHQEHQQHAYHQEGDHREEEAPLPESTTTNYEPIPEGEVQEEVEEIEVDNSTQNCEESQEGGHEQVQEEAQALNLQVQGQDCPNCREFKNALATLRGLIIEVLRYQQALGQGEVGMFNGF